MTKTAWAAVIGWALVGTVAIFLIGCRFGYGVGIDACEDKLTAAELEAAKKYEDSQKKLAEALAARDKALRANASLRASANSLRDKLSARGDADAKTGRDSGNSDRERLGQCERLLGEGSGLVGEGVELSGRLSADKDALAATR